MNNGEEVKRLAVKINNTVWHSMSLMRRQDLSPSEKVVAISVAYLTRKGPRPLSVERIAANAGVSRDTALDALKKLERQDIVYVTRHSGKPSQYEMCGGRYDTQPGE